MNEFTRLLFPATFFIMIAMILCIFFYELGFSQGKLDVIEKYLIEKNINHRDLKGKI